MDDRELAVPSRQTAPLLQVTEPRLDDVAAAVVDLVTRRRAAATRSTSMPVPCLIGRFGDDRTDPAAAQQIPFRAGGVRLVAVRECGAVTRLAG